MHLALVVHDQDPPCRDRAGGCGTMRLRIVDDVDDPEVDAGILELHPVPLDQRLDDIASDIISAERPELGPHPEVATAEVDDVGPVIEPAQEIADGLDIGAHGFLHRLCGD